MKKPEFYPMRGVVATGLSLMLMMGVACAPDEEEATPLPPPGVGLANRFEGLDVDRLSPADVEDYEIVVEARDDVKAGKTGRGFRLLRLIDNEGQIDDEIARDAVEATLVRTVRTKLLEGYIPPYIALDEVDRVDEEGQIIDRLADDVIEAEIADQVIGAIAEGFLQSHEALGIVGLINKRGEVRRRDVRDEIEPIIAIQAVTDLNDGLLTPNEVFGEFALIDNVGSFTREDAFAELEIYT